MYVSEISHGSEGRPTNFVPPAELYVSVISHGSEGELQNRFLFLRLYVSVISHGSERRPEEMICLKKVKIENGIWIGINFIFWIDCSMCVLLLTGQYFKAVRNQRKESLK